MKRNVTDKETERCRVLFQGIVQGVGFRPYLYRTARQFKLTGFVKNTTEGVILEVEGSNLDTFVEYTFAHLPPLSEVVAHQVTRIPLVHSTGFEIHASEQTSKSDLLVSPDIMLCDNCKRELLDPQDRRYLYPFINCTDCGPRMTIIRDLPYDRPLTTMAEFPMCEACKKEYSDPFDRRYHAQPVACFSCGPMLQIPGRNDANPLVTVAGLLKAGKIAAIKGLGGFHLACLASRDDSVLEMRRRKKRERKPFALMGTMKMVHKHCDISAAEAGHLQAPSAPILLLSRKQSSGISQQVAPGQNTIGFMLPYTPLHVLLLQEVGEPLMMTSANYSDEPIIFKDDSPGLNQLADVVLTNNREIHLFADDSVARVVKGDMYMIRRSRGYIPFPLTMPFNINETVLALGPMMKTTFTFWRGDKALSSPYIGTTDSPTAIDTQYTAIQHYMKLFAFKPEIIVMDKHPGYPNRLIARHFKQSRIIEIQHHRAHVGALLAETGEKGKIIGIAFDGTGYGDDGNIWGGEFFVGDYRNLERFGHLKYLFLPAGDKSIKEPWRFSLSLLFALYGETEQTIKFAEQFGKRGMQQLEIIKQGIGGVMTSSSGRIFDAAASLLDIGQSNYFDGDLPSQLQTIAEKYSKKYNKHGLCYDYAIEETTNQLDLLPLFDDMINDNSPLAERAYVFHNTLAAGITEMACRARETFGIEKVALTGGVFQNTLLLELTMGHLHDAGLTILIHSQVPANDGGISVGQAYLAGMAEES